MLGNNLFGEPAPTQPSSAALAKAFILPPFSVLNAREGWWQERKRAWQALGIKSELGRGEVQGSLASARRAQLAAPGRSPLPAADYSKSQARGDGTGKAHAEAQGEEEDVESWVTSSIFDPVVCEIVYRWFCPVGGLVLDPFAGGSVRGIVASRLARHYRGIDLRPEQCEANREQASLLCSEPLPAWECGDSRDLAPPTESDKADLLFSCPPYGDLEVYSDDPRDLSQLDYPAFKAAHAAIIKAAAEALKTDRFAVWVVGDFRCKRGLYRGFPWDTIEAFRDVGMSLYNEAVLITAVGSLPVRSQKQFKSSRKLGKTHQNILVFVKGDPKKAAKACGDVVV